MCANLSSSLIRVPESGLLPRGGFVTMKMTNAMKRWSESDEDDEESSLHRFAFFFVFSIERDPDRVPLAPVPCPLSWNHGDKAPLCKTPLKGYSFPGCPDKSMQWPPSPPQTGYFFVLSPGWGDAPLTICPETITEIICFNFWDVKITSWRQKLRHRNHWNPL